MRNVPMPIAISPFYSGQTIEALSTPASPANLIPDYKNITLQNVVDTTPGDVLIGARTPTTSTE